MISYADIMSWRTTDPYWEGLDGLTKLPSRVPRKESSFGNTTDEKPHCQPVSMSPSVGVMFATFQVTGWDVQVCDIARRRAGTYPGSIVSGRLQRTWKLVLMTAG